MSSRYRRVSLLVRNLPKDIRAEDLRGKFERYGEVRDIYLPRDYYTGEPRGFGFIEFRDARDADDALRSLDRSVIGGREISVVMSKEARKTPGEMSRREIEYRATLRRGGRDDYYDRRDDYDRRDRDRRRDRSRSRSRDRRRSSRSRSRSRGRSYSRSRSPARRRDSRSPSRSPAPARSGERSRSPTRSPARDKERSPAGRSPAARSRSASPRDD